MIDGSANVEFEWGDDTHKFRLGLKELRELQAKAGDVGPYALYKRIAAGNWKVDDLRETIRLGLIGGGLTPPEALTLVKRYVDDRPWTENAVPAQVILTAALLGPDTDSKKKT